MMIASGHAEWSQRGVSVTGLTGGLPPPQKGSMKMSISAKLFTATEVSFVVVCALACLASSAPAATIYVNGTTGDDTWDGLCEEWDGGTCGPKATIQAGIDAALDGDQVVVADGVYTGAGNKNLDFAGKAITVRSISGDPETCVIDCENDGRGFYFHSGETEASIVAGLGIRNGMAAGSGGAVHCSSSSPVLINCAFTDNEASLFGGAVYCEQGDPTLENCTLRGNTAIGGGGLTCSESNATITGCTISENTVDGHGGGIMCRDGSSPTLTNCVIDGNESAWAGGGVECWFGSSPTFIDVTISGNIVTEGEGGGVDCFEGCSPTFVGCTLAGNLAAQNGGGGIFCDKDCYPQLEDCELTQNVTLEGGGAACAMWASHVTLTGCTVTANTAVYYDGGAVFCYLADGATITDCVLSDNTAGGDGGAICSVYATSVTISDSTITGNEAGWWGGGIDCSGGALTVTNCEIADNVAALNGGGVSDSSYSTFTNCLIVANAADLGGGVFGSGTTTLTNCTLAGNEAVTQGGGVHCYGGPTLVNCVLWNNTPEAMSGSCSAADVTYTDIQGGWAGVGNIDADPLFVDPDGPDDDPETWEDNDYRLAAGSPCIDAADNTAVPADTLDLDGDGDVDEPIPFDLDGNPRFVDDPDTDDTGVGTPPIVDMGAYEYWPFAVGDLNCDGVVDFFDIDPFVMALVFPEEYETTYPDCSLLNADCNGDGIVDFFDLDPFVALIVD